MSVHDHQRDPKQTFHNCNYFRKKAEAVKWRGHESARRGGRDSKVTPEFMASGHSNVSINTPYGFKKESGRYDRGKLFSASSSMIHPSLTATLNKNKSSRSNVGDLRANSSNNVPVTMGGYSSSSSQKENAPSREPTTVITEFFSFPFK